MFSNKENVNILTALLSDYGVQHAVVCPGSRNAPIVHNLNECAGIACHPVTDERSAGFYALGMAQNNIRPVAVCVTSGTALLNLLPAVAVYLGWNWLYNINYGLFNFILNRIFHLPRVGFVNDAKLVAPSLALVSVWLAGNLIVIFLAGLQNVPRTYLEAAEVDGANAWQRFWNITIPCMSPIIFYNLLMALITNLQVITPALALTKGGPGSSSRFVSYVMYQYAFESRKFGYAAAVSVMLFVLIGIFTVILFATSKSWMFNQGGDD